MKARDALAHIRTLIKAAEKSESVADIRRVHREVLQAIEMGLGDGSNVVPIRPGPGDSSDGPKVT